MTDIPYVWKAVKLLFADEGIEYEGIMPDSFYKLPKGHNWEVVNAFLATLSEDELETFCIGEQNDQLKIAARGGSAQYAHKAIEDIWLDLMGVDE